MTAEPERWEPDMNIKKTAIYLSGAGKAAILSGIPLLAVPTLALADSHANTVFQTAHEKANGNTDQKLTGERVSNTVTGIVTWVLGLVIIIFVLKVVLTGVDRILNDPDNSASKENSVLTKLPIVGAYPPPTNGPDGSEGYSWSKVWMNFAMQIAIAVGAWFIVNLISGIMSQMFRSSGV